MFLTEDLFATTAQPAPHARLLLLDGLRRARQGQPEDLVAALSGLPDPSEMPSPWASWTFLELVRYRQRQRWAREQIRASLPELPALAREVSYEEPLEGEVPGSPQWRYEIDLEDGYCRLTHSSTGELIEVDLEAGEMEESAFHLVNLLDSWGGHEAHGPGARFRQLHPVLNSMYLSGLELKEYGLLEKVFLFEDCPSHSERLMPIDADLVEDVERFCEAWDEPASRPWLGALINDWPAAFEAAVATGDPDLIALTGQRSEWCRERRIERLRPILESGDWGRVNLGAIQQVDGQLFEEYTRRALGAGGIAARSALTFIEDSTDPAWTTHLERLFQRLGGSVDRSDMDLRGECARLLARRGEHGPEIIEAIAQSGWYLGEAILVALEHAPEMAEQLIRRGLRSGVDSQRLETAAILALIGRPWATAELFSAFVSAAAPGTPWSKEALLQTSDPSGRDMVEWWEQARPAKVAPEESEGPEDDRDRADEFRAEMERLQERVAPLRDKDVEPALPDFERLDRLVAPFVSEGGQRVIGAGIKGVNDSAARTRFAMTITQHEARVLYEYWYRRYSDVLDMFAMECTGSSEIRTHPYAASRMNHLHDFVGDDFLETVSQWCEEDDQVRVGIREEFRKEHSEDPDWREAGME